MATHSPAHAEHSHPTPGLYIKIAVVLFVLTALEVLTFEGGRGGLGPALQPIFEPIVVLILVVFSGAKFILVAMFYMHLKQDPKVLSNLFIWPLVIAAGLLAALIILLSYWRVVGGMVSPSAGG
jgi:cytochrome c oxidase subunit 4